MGAKTSLATEQAPAAGFSSTAGITTALAEALTAALAESAGLAGASVTLMADFTRNALLHQDFAGTDHFA